MSYEDWKSALKLNEDVSNFVHCSSFVRSIPSIEIPELTNLKPGMNDEADVNITPEVLRTFRIRVTNFYVSFIIQKRSK